MSTVVTGSELRLLDLCKRLLGHNEQLHARTDYLHGVVRLLGTENRALRAELDRTEADRAVTEEASEIFLGIALDELASGTSGYRP